MRFLVDAQLPEELVDILNNLGLDSIHTNNLPKKDGSSDKEIWEIADSEGRIVITKDYDFYHAHMSFGRPKKLLLITTGNIANKVFFSLIQTRLQKIVELFETCHLVEISNTEIIGIE